MLENIILKTDDKLGSTWSVFMTLPARSKSEVLIFIIIVKLSVKKIVPLKFDTQTVRQAAPSGIIEHTTSYDRGL